MTPPAVIVTDVDTLRQIIRDEVAAVLAAQQPTETPTVQLNPTTHYTVQEFAALRRCSDQVIYAAVRAGKLPCVRNGRRICIPETELHTPIEGAA